MLVIVTRDADDEVILRDALKMEALVSTIIPTIGRTRLLEDAISSALNQRGVEQEVIVVVDDIEAYSGVLSACSAYNVRVVVNDGRPGPAGARNYGVNISKGDYIAFLDDDDIWHPEKLKSQVAVFNENSNDVGVVFCQAVYYDSTTGVIRYTKREVDAFTKMSDIITGIKINGPPTALFKKHCFNDAGAFDENISYWEDQELYARVCRLCAIISMPDIMTLIRVNHGYNRLTDQDSINCKRSAEALKYIYEKHELDIEGEMGTKMLVRVAQEYLKAKEFKRSTVATLHACVKYRLNIRPLLVMMRMIFRGVGVRGREKKTALDEPYYGLTDENRIKEVELLLKMIGNI